MSPSSLRLQARENPDRARSDPPPSDEPKEGGAGSDRGIDVDDIDSAAFSDGKEVESGGGEQAQNAPPPTVREGSQ
jgi:hypothetical protein